MISDLLLVTPDFRTLADLTLLAAPLLVLALAGDRFRPANYTALVALTVGGFVNRWLLAAAAIAALIAWRRAPQAILAPPLPAAPPRAATGRQQLALLVFCALAVSAFINDGGDAWWWLNEGRVIAQHGLNESEWFTASIPGVLVPPNDWLSALFAFRLHALGGWPALRALALVCVLLPVAVALAGRRLAPRLALAAFAGCWLIRDELSLRAVITVLPLLALAQWWCGAARRALPAAFAFAALTALWANLHLSFFIGLIFPVARLAATLFAAPRGTRRFDIVAAAMLAGGLAGACLHPLGIGVYAAVARMLATEGTRLLDIFQPPDFAAAAFLPALLWCALMLLAWRDAPPAARLATALLLVAFLAARRNLLFLVPAALPLFAFRPPASSDDGAAAPAAPGAAAGLRAALLLLFSVTVIILITTPAPPLGHPAQNAVYAWLAANAPDNVPVLNHYVLGGRLGWQAYPRRLVFIDGRNHLFEPTAIWRDYLAVHFLSADFPLVLARYPFRYALWPEHHPVAAALRARGWSPLCSADGVLLLGAPAQK